MTMNDATELKAAIRKAAGSVLLQWEDVIEQDDLEQELWMWLLERPSAQEKLGSIPVRERHLLLVRQGHLIASKANQDNIRFNNGHAYSVDDVKALLRGEGVTHEDMDYLEEAMETLRDQNPRQADVIKQKYGFGEPLGSDAARHLLSRAHVSLADEINRLYREKLSGFDPEPGRTLGDGPGTRSVVSNSTAQASLTSY